MQRLRLPFPYVLAMPLTAFLLACAVSVSLSARHQPPPSGVTLTASAWNIRYGSRMPAHPSPLVGMAGWWLDVPLEPGSLNYVTTAYTTPLPQGQSVIFTAQIVATSGTPVFNFMLEPSNTCTYPAHVRAYFEQGTKHDVSYAPATYRWWANPIAVELAEGVATVTVPLTPEQWSDAAGEIGSAQLAGFEAALAHPGAIGLTFGGGCFFGHGVNVSGGTARFILSNYVVQ
jgi:hypothetical protein